MAVQFKEWVESVDRVLPSHHPGTTVFDLDRDLMRKAFEEGESPVAFARRQDLAAADGSAVPSAPASAVDPVSLSQKYLAAATTLWIAAIALFAMGAIKSGVMAEQEDRRFVRELNRLEQNPASPPNWSEIAPDGESGSSFYVFNRLPYVLFYPTMGLALIFTVVGLRMRLAGQSAPADPNP